MRFFEWIGLRVSPDRRQQRRAHDGERARMFVVGKLVLSALGIALAVTPAFAHSVRHGHAHMHRPATDHTPQYGYIYNGQGGYTYVPPPSALLYAPVHGNAYMPVYVPGFGNIGSNGASISNGGPE